MLLGRVLSDTRKRLPDKVALWFGDRGWTFAELDDANDQGEPDELRVEGVVSYDEPARCWVAAIDWSAIRHASEDAAPNANGPISSDPRSPQKRGPPESRD